MLKEHNKSRIQRLALKKTLVIRLLAPEHLEREEESVVL